MPKLGASQELEGFFPLPYTGVPWMMSLLCVLLFNIAFIFLSRGGIILLILSIAFLKLSTGSRVELPEKKLLLKFGIPRIMYEIEVDSIKEIARINFLRRGVLFKHFRGILLEPLLLILIPYLGALSDVSKPTLIIFPIEAMFGFFLLAYFILPLSNKKFKLYASLFIALGSLPLAVKEAQELGLGILIYYGVMVSLLSIAISMGSAKDLILIESESGKFVVAGSYKMLIQLLRGERGEA
ncbi:hypothetical protein [Thermococcus sp.]